MKELANEELKEINGGGVWTIIGITAAIIFIIGAFDGFTRPLACHK